MSTAAVVGGVLTGCLLIGAACVVGFRRGRRNVAESQTSAWIAGFTAGVQFVRSGENTKVISPDYYTDATLYDH